MLPVSPNGRRYGAYRGNANHPARRLLALAHTGAELPKKTSNFVWMGQIRDQGDEGSCTGQMKAEIRDFLYRKLYSYERDRSVPASGFRASASFAYKTNLIADGMLGQDAGSTIHTSVITLNQYGVCLDSLAPYSDKDFSTKPSDAQYANALLYKGGSYHFLPDLQTMKECLASGYSFGFGIDVYESFEGDWQSTGLMPMPRAAEQLLGGHAQHVVDFDDTVQFPDGEQGGFFVQNSWGSGWGISAPGREDRGCYWMPYKYIEQGFTDDAWILHLGKAWG